MKKQFFLILSLFISAVTFSQKKITAPPSNISFGVRAGLVNAGMRGDAANNLDNLLNFTGGGITTNNVTGFFAGGYATIPVGNMVSIEPGLYYAEKGYGLTGSLNIKGVGFLGASGKATLQSQYLDIPVLLKANVGGGLQFFAGPQFSYLMKANLHSTAGLLGINILSNDLNATAQFNHWDAAVTGGIGYSIKNGINIMASYDYGLNKLDANKNASAYNQAFKVGIGISL